MLFRSTLLAIVVAGCGQPPSAEESGTKLSQRRAGDAGVTTQQASEDANAVAMGVEWPSPAEDADVALVVEEVEWPPPVVTRLPKGRACLSAKKAGIQKHRGIVNKKNQAAFELALKTRGLTRQPLGPRFKRLRVGLSYRPPEVSVGSVVEMPASQGFAGQAGRYIAGSPYWTGNLNGAETAIFVSNEKGEIFRVVRRTLQGDATTVVLCGCRPHKCGPFGSPCPGCGATLQPFYGPLPQGSTYKGDVEIAHPLAGVALEYVGKSCPPAPVCSPPPSSAR